MILLIEPSKDLSKVISDSLSVSGVDVLVAHTSQQAIQMAEGVEIELIILELLIPRHNGLEFIYELRSYSDWSDVPIIIYSQISAEELVLPTALKRDMGIIKHLYKPTTSLQKLSFEVHKILSVHEPAT